jgi:hypothetical protein
VPADACLPPPRAPQLNCRGVLAPATRAGGRGALERGLEPASGGSRGAVEGGLWPRQVRGSELASGDRVEGDDGPSRPRTGAAAPASRMPAAGGPVGSPAARQDLGVAASWRLSEVTKADGPARLPARPHQLRK